ncbi:MAG TPA: C25 family cysteine peptidase [Flavobacteriales bacterium]|nr:C25 family cysteine peptidase [Flavobacteriales bacterium]
MLKSFTLSTLALTGLALAANAQTSVTQDGNTTVIDFTTGTHIIQNLTTGGKAFEQNVKIIDAETTPILEKGAPDLGKYAYTIVLPSFGKPVVSVEEGTYTEYKDVFIAPSKGSLKRNVNPKDVAPFYGEMYANEFADNAFTDLGFYPKQRALINEPFNLRNVRGASVHIFPYAYNASTHVLRVYNTLKVTITNDMSEAGINPLMSNNQFETGMDPVYDHLFINYKQVKSALRYSPINEKGAMLIITPPSCTTAIQPLADWKEQRGIETEIVTTTTTGTTQSAIASYISSYYGTHSNLMFVLLIGDHEQLTAFNAGSTGSETKWSDSKYGMITGSDWYPEVLVGRLPAKTAAQCTDMVNKTLEYEKTPLSGTWYTRSIGIGSDEGAGIGDEGQADWQHMRAIRTELMSFGYTTVDEFYDGSHGGADAAGDPNNTMVATAVNSGASLFMYCGHGSMTTCVTSNYSTTDINAATNNGKYPFVISVACNNGTFPGGECLTEVFLRAKNASGTTGAIGACGSSILMAWAEPMETEDEISKILSGVATGGNLKYTLGGLFYNGQYSMLEDYPSSTGREVMETWIMFGDPSVMMRSKVPSTLSITAPSCYTEGSNLTVTGGIAGADVAVTQNGNIVGSDVIAGGTATFPISGAVTGSVTLTVTGYNQLPYTTTLPACIGSGVAEVAPVGIKIYPNPATDLIYIENGGGMTYVITDAIGKTVASGTYNSSINVEAFNRGMYFVKVKNNSNEVQTVRFIKK